MHVHCSIKSLRTEACGMQFDGPMQGQAQAAAAAGMVLRYVGSLDLVHRKCSVALKVVLHQNLCCALNHLYIAHKEFIRQDGAFLDQTAQCTCDMKRVTKEPSVMQSQHVSCAYQRLFCQACCLLGCCPHFCSTLSACASIVCLQTQHAAAYSAVARNFMPCPDTPLAPPITHHPVLHDHAHIPLLLKAFHAGPLSYSFAMCVLP